MLVVKKGACELKGGKLGTEYLVASVPGQLTDRFLCFVARTLRGRMGGAPGAMYELEGAGEDKWRTGEAKYVGQWPDVELVATWVLNDAAVRNADRMRKAEAKAKHDVLECLGPARRAYQEAVGDQRTLILARVIQYVTGRG